MIARILSVISAMIMSAAAFAADGDTSAPRRVSIFSTSTDWEAVTNLPLAEYRGTFVGDKKLVGSKGLILYYLDGFPCYGLGSWARAWISPAGKADEHLRIACVYPPTEIKFAWRNAPQGAVQAATTGVLTCAVDARGRDFTINLNKCEKGPDWSEYK